MRAWIKLLSCGVICFNQTISGETRWTRITSPNFEMYTTAGERSAKDTLRYFEQVRSFFTQMAPHWLEKPVTVRIVAFNSMKEYEPYRLNSFAAAYYLPSPSHEYIVMSHTGAETFPVAIHEYVHLVVRHSGLKIPPWLNEGLAELYSTLKPMGDKILVGSLIAGRYQALLQEKWVGLGTIMAAGHDSPYYNEKDKAGSLYNEGWALTHMLALSQNYRNKFSDVLHSISEGTPSADALERVYSKPVKEIESDLMSYLRGGRFQGVLIPAKFQKIEDDLKAVPADEFDFRLVLTELGDRPSQEQATRKTLEDLIAHNPGRGEAHIDLAYLELRQQRSGEAREQFAKAFDLGSRDASMLWDYGRIVESSDADKSLQVLSELMAQQPDRVEVRLEIASVQLRSHRAKDALQTLAPVKKINREDAPHLFTLLAYANLELGDKAAARDAANQLKKFSTDLEDRDRADKILQFIESARLEATTPRPAPEDGDARPVLARHEATGEPARMAVKRPSFTGKFVELQCAQPAKIILETAEGKKLLLIDDPTRLLLNGKSGETMDLSCGSQKSTQVRIEYDPPGSSHRGVDGLARAIYFEP